MDYFRQTIVSNKLSGIFELPPVLRDRQVEVIILPVENDVEKKPNYALKLGFLKDKVPPLPDSFFEPLPEEELEAWGL